MGASVSEPKPLASLSSSLLARKGQAKPAMRPQGFGTFGAQSTGFDDLGWNDMGHDRPHVPLALTPMEADVVPIHAEMISEPGEADETPVVVQQREEIARSFEPQPAPSPPMAIKTPVAIKAPVAVKQPVALQQPVALPVTVRAAPGSKAKSAFTLRLDAERHLKLRLASAFTHRSAQAIVVEALDAFLTDHPATAGVAPDPAN